MGITTSTSAGRDELLHPDLGHDGGSGLWNKVNTMFTKISDSLSVQFFGPFTVADTATQDITHNFSMALTDLEVHIMESAVVLSQEAQSVYGIAGHPTTPTKAIRITNNSGGSKTFTVYVIGFSLDKLLGREKGRMTTTSAVTATLAQFNVPTNESLVFDCTVCARVNATTANLYKFSCLAENNAGTTTVTVIESTQSEESSPPSCVIDTDGAAGVRVRVTGIAATNIDWACVGQKTYF